MANKLTSLILLIALATASAFVPMMAPSTKSAAFNTQASFPQQQSTALSMADDMSWEGEEYPPSKVLGPLMSRMGSGQLGLISIAFASICVYSIFQSSILEQEPGALASGSWVKWYYVAGSFGGPFAWGTHVAAWIQRKNGM